MAKKYVLICDPHKEDDGAEHDAVKTRTLALDGEAVEVDLCPDYDNQVTSLFALMRRCGRPVVLTPVKASRTRGKTPGRPSEAREIRMWCAKQNPPIEVNERGRPSERIKQQYYAARRQTREL